MRIVNSTYAYHSGSEKADLKVATEILARYVSTPLPHAAGINPSLEWDIKQNGILYPVKLYTNGLVGHLGDGNHRIRLAQKLGIGKVPLQIVPESFRRFSTAANGLPLLHSVLQTWVDSNLWVHDKHNVTRHVIGGGTSSIKPNRFVKCVCSCGSRWKEDI